MRLNFSSPPKNKIIVFDGESLPDLKYILENHKFFVLENRSYRVNHIYCGLIFLLYYLLNFLKLFFTKKLLVIFLSRSKISICRITLLFIIIFFMPLKTFSS